jgi:lipopolysaccharide exporter
MPDRLQGRMARGAVWMVLFKLVERGLGLISTLILARVLMPDDFGIVAMAMSFIAMGELLGAFGFDVALIQNSSANREHYDSAWTCSLLLGLSITLGMLALALPIARFYGYPELLWVVIALAFGPLLSSLENIGVVAFRKELEFRNEFIYQVTRKLMGFLVVVPMAFVLRSYWALVIGILFSKAAGTVISYLMHPFRPRLSFARFRQLFHFSRWLLLNNFVNFAKERSADFFIGRLGGAASLGTYNVAYELSNLPTTEISAPINRALLPGFAKMESTDQIETTYTNAVGLLALVALPAAACIFAVAPYVVATLLGPKWQGATPLMQILAFNGALLLFQSSMCSVLFGRGHPASVTFSNLAYSLLLVVLLALFLNAMPEHKLVGAAYAALGTSILCSPLYLYQMWRNLRVSPMLFVRAVRRPFLGAAASVIVVNAVLPTFDAAMPLHVTAMLLMLGVTAALGTYIVSVLLAWRLSGRPAGPEQIALEFIWAQIGSRVTR